MIVKYDDKGRVIELTADGITDDSEKVKLELEAFKAEHENSRIQQEQLGNMITKLVTCVISAALTTLVDYMSDKGKNISEDEVRKTFMDNLGSDVGTTSNSDFAEDQVKVAIFKK